MHSAICTYPHSTRNVVECCTCWKGQLSGGRVRNKLVQIVGIAAGVRDVLELCPERGIEWEEVGVSLCETQRRNFLLNQAPGKRRIGNPDALEIQFKAGVLVDPVGDVRNVWCTV